MYQPQIIASQITNLTDARYFAAWNVEWLGFTLEKGAETFISPTQVNAIKAWVAGPKVVGSFSGLDIEEIQTSIDLLSLDAIEVSRFADLTALDLSIPIIVNITIEAEMTTDELTKIIRSHDRADYFILDFEKNNLEPKSNAVVSMDFLKTVCANKNIFLRMSFPTDELNSWLETIQPCGIQLVGGEEEKVGVKTYEELDDILETMEPMRLED